MCGHIGVAGDLLIRDEKVFKQGLIVDSLRGDHSTGVLSVPRNDNDPKIAKQVGNPFELFNDKRFDHAMSGNHRVLLGHNRFATHGAVNRANAHPFNFDHIYGAHNGTLNSWTQLDGYSDFRVDSQALYDHIAKFGVEDAISKVQGAWALVWWNRDDSTLNFLRNDQRTLFYALSEDGKQLYWASEREMISLLAARNSLKIQNIKIFPLDTWVRYPIEENGKLGKPKAKKVEGKKYNPPVVYTGSNRTITTGGKTSVIGTGEQKFSFTEGVIRQNVLLEVGRKCLDSNKAAYVKCLDAENTNERIRLYLKPGDEFKFKTGFVIKGHIQSFMTAEGGYFKVLHSSVQSTGVEEQVKFDEKMGRFDSNGKYVVDIFRDHEGHFLSKKDWEKKYPYCSWCSSDLNAEEENLISNDGDVLCPDCSKNEEIRAYI